ncbi:hypothetical protein T552_02546 [Pneumocystis carinii B80]|uniref:Actin-like protein ARP6 n=1 Tax=Pneumocystis carinii (strain B80) TaxID=1408658 RepID=A0A0W4ZFA4_PNEC8|nr:hypothetical protein T552_02546 [Pneumocystis carinii B80]KTW27054.1 hypothetical protein T552_02546 [Pneumocystis carinii B80]
MTILVVDNGGYSIKYGFSSDDLPRISPNCIAKSVFERKTYIGSQISGCKDFSSLRFRRPIDRGYLVNWESEKVIWDYLFSQKDFRVDYSETSLLVTEPPYNFPQLQSAYDQIIFEEYEFQSYYRLPWNNSEIYGTSKEMNRPREFALVIDSGFSFTHVVPYFLSYNIHIYIFRLNVGGKLLTNYLKEIISFRHYNIMEEFSLADQIKKSCFFVSSNFNEDIEISKGKKPGNVSIDYVLPDYSTNDQGFVLTSNSQRDLIKERQILTLKNERFIVPEVMFNPSIIKLSQAGIHEAIMQSLKLVESDFQELFLANIILVGGNSFFKGYSERLKKELQSLAPAYCKIVIYQPHNPDTFAWVGGSSLACNTKIFDEKKVTRAEYMEYGSNIFLKKNGLNLNKECDLISYE